LSVFTTRIIRRTVVKSRRRTASVSTRRFEGQVVYIAFTLAVKKDVEINGYCAIQSTRSIITLLPLILFSFHLTVTVVLAIIKHFNRRNAPWNYWVCSIIKYP
jgi:hypothetical protein